MFLTILWHASFSSNFLLDQLLHIVSENLTHSDFLFLWHTSLLSNLLLDQLLHIVSENLSRSDLLIVAYEQMVKLLHQAWNGYSRLKTLLATIHVP